MPSIVIAQTAVSLAGLRVTRKATSCNLRTSAYAPTMVSCSAHPAMRCTKNPAGVDEYLSVSRYGISPEHRSRTVRMLRVGVESSEVADHCEDGRICSMAIPGLAYCQVHSFSQDPMINGMSRLINCAVILAQNEHLLGTIEPFSSSLKAWRETT